MTIDEAAAELGEDDPEVLAAYMEGGRKLSEWEQSASSMRPCWGWQMTNWLFDFPHPWPKNLKSIPSKIEEREITDYLELFGVNDEDELYALCQRCLYDVQFRREVLRLARSPDGAGWHRLMSECTPKAS